MCSSTRCIRSTRGACFAGAMRRHGIGAARIRPNQRGRACGIGLRSGAMRRPRVGRKARSTGCCRPASRCCGGGSCLMHGGIRRPAGDACRGHDRLCRHHQPLRRRGHDRRDGLRVFVLGDERADGFSDGQIAALQRIMPFLALAIKSVSLARMTGTLMQTYLGRDAGQRVLSGRILRGVADRIDAVHLVQRPARLHPHHRHRARAGDPAAERLRRRHRLGDPRAWRRCAQADRRRHARDLHGRRSARAPVERRARRPPSPRVRASPR